MNIHRSLRSRAARSLCKSAATLALALACWSPAQRVEATGVPVIDVSAIFQSAQQFWTRSQEWIETQAQYASVLKHYTDQVAFWQEQLVKLQGLQYDIFNITQTYKPIPPTYGVQERCPGASTSIISSIGSQLTSALTESINADGNIASSQDEICVKTVVAENKKYNFTVQYFAQLSLETSALTRLQMLRLSSIQQSTANMIALSGDTSRFQANIASAKSTWEAQMLQQDTEISLLKTQQSIFARRAMNGKPSIVGSLVNAAVLEAVFHAGK